VVIDTLKKLLVRKIVQFKVMRFEFGFVSSAYSYKRKKVFFREVLLPTKFLIEMGEDLKDKEGSEKLLYQIGKNFTWNYWEALGVSEVKNFYEIEKYWKDAELFMEIFYASSINHQILAEKLLYMQLRNYMICSEGGTSSFNLGTFAGLLGRTIKDKQIEAVEVSCQGQGREYCEVYVGLPSELKKKVPETEIITSEVEEYNAYDLSYKLYNRPVSSFRGTSLLDLLREDIFSYSEGTLSLLGRFRFFPLEILGLHLLERNLEGPVLKASYEVGREIGEVLPRNDVDFLFNLISALGFGVSVPVSIAGELRVRIEGYPYSKLLNFNFPYLRGFIKGLMEGSLGGEYEVKPDKYLLGNNLQLLLVIRKSG